MRFIDYDGIFNPIKGDVYFDKDDQIFKMWDGAQWVTIMLNSNFNHSNRKKELIEEFENNPELFNDVFNEIRIRKIQKLIK